MLIIHHHVPIHLFVHEPESQGLIPYQCLVMRFSIGDIIFFVPTVAKGVPHLLDVPVFVLLVLKDFNPIIRYSHSQAKIKAQTAFFDRTTGTGHTAHVFGYTDGIGTNFVDEFIGKLDMRNDLAPFKRIKARVEHLSRDPRYGAMSRPAPSRSLPNPSFTSA